MDRQKEPPVDTRLVRKELHHAKDRLAEQAEKLSLKEQLAKHPYISMGAAFVTGIVLGGSGEIRGDFARIVAEVISKEILQRKK